MKLSFSPSIDDLQNVESDVDFRSILSHSERLFERGEIEKACQIRLETALEVLEELDKSDQEIELDMSKPENCPIVEVLVVSGSDHYQICDFEMAATLLETALLLDSEDNFSCVTTLAYCYIALEEWDILEEIEPLLSLSRVEAEFYDTLKKIARKEKASLSPALQVELTSTLSTLRPKVEPLLLHFPSLLSK